MLPPSQLKSWTRNHADEEFLCTTDPKYIQFDALNAALGSDLIWWGRGVSETDLRTMVDHSLCIGLYTVNSSDSTACTPIPHLPPLPSKHLIHTPNKQPPAPPSHAMIGFARLITDYVTFAYLTDVYVLPSHQRKGLAKWMMECLDSVLSSWPELRRTMLLTGDAGAVRLYEKTLGMSEMKPGKLSIMQKVGPGASHVARNE